MMQPNWRDAPAGANHLAMDGDGMWFWHANTPRWASDFANDVFGCWESDGEIWSCDAEIIAANSLQSRPESES